MIPLDQNARFHPDGVPSRACELCYSAYQRWEETRSKRLDRIQTLLDAQSGDPTAVKRIANGEGQEESDHDAFVASLNQQSEIAASVPRDWNWSTF